MFKLAKRTPVSLRTISKTINQTFLGDTSPSSAAAPAHRVGSLQLGRISTINSYPSVRARADKEAGPGVDA